MSSLVQDVPSELKEFARVFDKLSYGHGNYGTCFHDFVSHLSGGMLLQGNPDLANQLKKNYGKNYDLFFELQRELLLAYHKKISHDMAWYDGLGIFYESIASRRKSSHLGQFFTPPCICDLMAAFTVEHDSKSSMDCCSGSGRLLLAAKVRNPSGKFFASDVDPVCFKMTAINMALHGCQGEASCMDALRMDWRTGFRVNPLFGIPGILPLPHLAPIDSFEQSMFFVRTSEVKKAAENIGKHGQLMLF
jgi:type I restriction enzyme M protein